MPTLDIPAIIKALADLPPDRFWRVVSGVVVVLLMIALPFVLVHVPW